VVRYHQIFRKGRFPIKMPELCSSSKKGLVSQCLVAPLTVPFVNIFDYKVLFKVTMFSSIPLFHYNFYGQETMKFMFLRVWLVNFFFIKKNPSLGSKT
jgi:hypothetical protein